MASDATKSYIFQQFFSIKILMQSLNYCINPTMLSTTVALLLTAVATASPIPTVIVPFGALGNVRITSLSETLLRFEPQGPTGYEDRTTFTVVNRETFTGGADLKLINHTTNEAWLTRTGWDDIYIKFQGNGTGPTTSCKPGQTSADANDPSRSADYPNGAVVADAGACCALCEKDQTCNMWVFATPSTSATLSKLSKEHVPVPVHDVPGANCWPLGSMSGTKSAMNREVGCKYADCSGSISSNPFSSIVIKGIDGTVKYDMAASIDSGKPLNVLRWPSPTAETSYALVDQPRFFVPSWGPTPMPKEEILKNPDTVNTNGYDYTNNVAGDTYVFLFSDKTLNSWHASRKEFLTLTGEVPLLPDFAFGTWFTYWHQYSEKEARGEVNRWKSDQLPIDVWALDMNWRDTPFACGVCKPCDQSKCHYEDNWNHYYNQPNTDLFPSLSDNGTGWFDFLQNESLRTYFNDHPFPADLGKALQTTPDEVNFRWDGLSHWMEKGLTYWWFDANWAFSIPPPQTQYGGSGDGTSWEGMDNRVWGSHVYYDTIRMYNQLHPTRDHTAPAQRPISLTKYADDNMVPGLVQHQHPAQHRYPVWWTGDGVTLQSSVQSMVDSGVYDLKPYVHSDCGGDYRGKVGGDLLRWASHCTFGTILRFHGEQHQPWSYDTTTENFIRQYLNMRYKLMPSLIAAGHSASETGFPLVVRLDFFYPQHIEATNNEQYLHLNDTLIAPIWDSSSNVTTRNVWIPPGIWEDGWDGSRVVGPKNITSSQPYSRIPMWHKVGGMMITTDEPGLRVDDQNWHDELILDVYVGDNNMDADADADVDVDLNAGDYMSIKSVYDRKTSLRDQTLRVHHDGVTLKTFVTSHHENIKQRTWIVRYHLAPNQSVIMMTMNKNNIDVTMEAPTPKKLSPIMERDAWKYFPFSGSGSHPAPNAGDIVEIRMENGVNEITMILN